MFCALFIGATVAGLFLEITMDAFRNDFIRWSFLGGILCFSLALICFLAETLLATHTLRFSKPSTGRRLPLEREPHAHEETKP